MSLLSVVQNVCKEIGLASPSSVIGNTDKQVIQLLALLNRAGRNRRDENFWPMLVRDTTITLVDGTADYSLPTDFNMAVAGTHFDQTSDWALIGPIDAEEWTHWNQGISAPPSRSLFRIKGFGSAKVYIFPTPDSGNAGDIYGYEYQSTYWVRTSAGTEGSKETYTIDTDVALFREDLLEMDLLWRWREAQRLDYGPEKLRADLAWAKEPTVKTGAETINLSRGKSRQVFLDSDNIPETIDGY